MFRVVYLDQNDIVQHKGGFDSDKAAYEWIEKHTDIIAIRLMVWSEAKQCFRLLEEFLKLTEFLNG